MCVAIFHKENKVVSNDILDKCVVGNDNGFGLIWIETDKLKTWRGMEYKEFKERYTNLISIGINKTSPIVLHLRAGNHPCIENCHPFTIKENELAFVHNGYIGGVSPKTGHSDTRAFCDDYLIPINEQVPIMENQYIRYLINLFVNTNKLIFLNNKKQYWIIGEKSGEWDDGIWYSNTYWNTKWDRWNNIEQTETKTVYTSNSITCDNCGKKIYTKKYLTITYGDWQLDYCLNCIKDTKLKSVMGYGEIDDLCFTYSIINNKH